ncbi:MAG: hypothetical protein LC667_09710 [Thioalkalivibrio sp.]|nr:hypothetical protein [Thioalkalivibrio sp.]
MVVRRPFFLHYVLMRNPVSPTEPPRSPGPLSNSWVRLGLLVCFLSALFAVVLFELPVAGTFTERSGGAAPQAAADPRCLQLAYDPPDEQDWMPTAVRLQPEVDPSLRQGRADVVSG